MYVLMIFVFSGLKDATPEMLLECIGPMFVIIVVGVIGMGILSIAVGKFLNVAGEWLLLLHLQLFMDSHLTIFLLKKLQKLGTNTRRKTIPYG